MSYLKNNHIAVLFPVGDVMTDLIAKNQNTIRQFTNLVLPPYDIFCRGRNKILTLKAAQRCGIPIPKTWYPREQSLESIAREACFPVLIKPALSAGGRGMMICHSRDELLVFYDTVEQNFGECFVQEFIPHTGMQYKADVIVDEQQNILAAVAYAKLRYYPPTGGSSVLNRTEYRPDIIETAHKLLGELKWVGFCDFDFITDARDNMVKLMEINPRYPESYRATVAAGVDMTKIMFHLAKGEKPIPQLHYRENKYLRFLLGDIMWFITTKENRWSVQPSFFSFFRSDTIDQLLRATDPGPIMGYLLENISMLWDKQARHFRLRRGPH
jgi:predicted ATP-grasp superfamily ATP-dependent carboligase